MFQKRVRRCTIIEQDIRASSLSKQTNSTTGRYLRWNKKLRNKFVLHKPKADHCRSIHETSKYLKSCREPLKVLQFIRLIQLLQKTEYRSQLEGLKQSALAAIIWCVVLEVIREIYEYLWSDIKIETISHKDKIEQIPC